MSEIVIGVDGGGSGQGHDRFRLMRSARVLDGPARYLPVRNSIGQCDRGSARAVSVRLPSGSSFREFCTVACRDWPEESARALHKALDERELAEEVIVDSDGLIALYDAFEDRAVLARRWHRLDRLRRSPSARSCVRGWGPTFGDEGGGVDRPESA